MTSPPIVLVVDDDEGQRELMRKLLAGRDLKILSAGSGEEALECLQGTRPHLVLLDMRMPGLGGLGTLARMIELGREAPVVVVTAFAEVEDAVQAMKLGARDYLRKPIDIHALQEILDRFLPTGIKGTRASSSPPTPEGFIFASPLMQQVVSELAAAAPTGAAVLLFGESGTGKEILADLLHRWSARAGSLVAINVSAVPAALVESELFGHEKGAFTGADQQRQGHFELASGGTLFLDEVGELPMEIQPKLLRALETRCVRRLGGKKEVPVDIRIVSATNRDLERDVEAGRFRMDLYYRIAAFTIEVPPLRERPEDVLPLARSFLSSLRPNPKSLTEAAEECLLAYGWPGNIRQLKNSLQRAAILSPGDWILPEHLPPGICRAGRAGKGAPGRGEPRALQEIEKEAILEAMGRCEGNKTRAALELGISRRKLIYKLKEYEAGSGSP